MSVYSVPTFQSYFTDIIGSRPAHLLNSFVSMHVLAVLADCLLRRNAVATVSRLQ